MSETSSRAHTRALRRQKASRERVKILTFRDTRDFMVSVLFFKVISHTGFRFLKLIGPFCELQRVVPLPCTLYWGGGGGGDFAVPPTCTDTTKFLVSVFCGVFVVVVKMRQVFSDNMELKFIEVWHKLLADKQGTMTLQAEKMEKVVNVLNDYAKEIGHDLLNAK